MKKSRFASVLGIFMLLIILCNLSYGAVEVFSRYDSLLKVNNDNTVEINKTLTLKNVYDVGIVPGQIEFKIGKGVEGSVSNLEIQELYAVDSYGNQIKSQLRTTKDFSTIILDIYYPLLPGFEYTFDLYYKLSYEPGGIFFKSLQIPLRESTIPIQAGEFKVLLPENFYFTYLDSEGKNATIEKNVATWTIKDDLPNSVVFEYSYLPVRFGDFKGSYVFWIGVNIFLLLVLIYEVRREIKKIKSGNASED